MSMKVLALGGSGGMGRFAVETCMNFDNISEVIVADINADAAIAFANTNLASATCMITWIFYDRFTNKKMSATGACIGAIVGLVAITPAAGFVNLGQSVFIGIVAAIVSNIAIRLTKKTKIDDTLDVFPSHGVGGIVGMILTAVFAKEDGLIYGETTVFYAHLITIVIVSVFIITTVRIRKRSNVRRCDPEISVDCMEEDAIELRILHFVQTTFLHQIPQKISIEIGVSLIFHTTLSRRELISRTTLRTSSKGIFRG